MSSEEQKQHENSDALPSIDLSTNVAASQSTKNSTEKDKNQLGSVTTNSTPDQRSVDPNLSSGFNTNVGTPNFPEEEKKQVTEVLSVAILASEISIETQSLNHNKRKEPQNQLHQPLSILPQQTNQSLQQLQFADMTRKTRKLPSNGSTSTSFQPITTNNPNTVSQSNISVNTSTYKRTDDEEGDLMFTSEDEDSKFNAANQADHVDICNNKRFYMYNDCISKSKYRTIHRGYDNESGCEIAWTTYRLHNDRRENLLKALDRFKALGQSPESQNRNILRVFYNEVRTSAPTTIKPKARGGDIVILQEELIVVSELITAGSIREYLKKIYSSLRINVIRSWCQKVLNALQFLHEHDIVHGELSCESIYINSNNGEIKVGDVGIKHIHTTDRSHELGACALYRKEKTTQKVDIFCLGLTLLEIVAASETGPSRSTLKYVIRIIKLGRKRDMLATLKYEPMRDFMEKALEEDPEKRFSAQQLLEHPFITTQANKSQMKLSQGLAVLIMEQVTYFKNQRFQHQSKTSNSIHLSVLNDSSQKKQLAQQSKPKTTASQFNDQQTKLPEQEESKDANNKNETQNEKGEGLTARPLFMKPELLKTSSLPEDLCSNLPHASNSSITKKPPEVAVVKQPASASIRTTSRYRGKTMSYLELPANRQKQLQIGTPKKKVMRQQPSTKAARQSSGKSLASRGAKGGGSATIYPSRGNRSKICGSKSPQHSSLNEFQISGKEPSSGTGEMAPKEVNQQRRSDPESNYAEVQPSSPMNFEQSEASRGGGTDQELLMSMTSPTLTASENCLFFRIQITMKGRKSDVKFPFDLQKDSPEAVANELQDYFLHSKDQMELPPHAVRAVQQEIQRGIECHYQSQPQITRTEGGSQTQTQSSYKNKVVMSMVEKQKDQREQPSKRRKSKATSAKPAQVAEETKTTPQDAEMQAAAEKEAKRQRIEERAQKREQREVEQRLAHDYLSMVPHVHSFNYSRSLSLPSCSEILELSSLEQSPASMQAEMNQMLKDGKLNEQEYFRRMQELAIRKLSISQNSAEQKRLLLLAEYPLEIEEPTPPAFSVAVIEFEPQIPHNNTTGERHEKLIEEQQKNGPYGQQALLHYRNSQDCKDPDLINFMHNPDEDEHRHLKEAKRNKYRRAKENNSAKSETQESLWLLRELFPGYMEKYQEDYENYWVHMPTFSVHQSSLVDLSQYTIDLSLAGASLQEGSHLSDQLKDLSQAPGPSEPFNVNVSVILPEPSQASSQVQQLSQAPIENEGAHQEGQSKPMVVSGAQVAGDSSSQQLQLPSDLDEALQQKPISQQRVSAKNFNHRSFLQDCSESFFMALGNNNLSGCINPANLHKLNKKDQQPETRPPSCQLQYNQPHLQGIKRPKKLNNSQQYTEVVSFPHGIAGSTNQMQSFHSHLDPQKQQMQALNAQKTSLTRTITEMPTVDINANPSSASGGITTTAGRVALSNKTTFDVQLSSQISDSQNSNKVAQSFLPRSSKVQHAINYSKDQQQIQVISSSLETSTNQHPIGPLPEASLEQDLDSVLFGLTSQDFILRNNPIINNLKMNAKQSEIPNMPLRLQKSTPSVNDVLRASVTSTSTANFDKEDALFGYIHQSRQRGQLQSMISMKDFPNVIDERESQEELKETDQASLDAIRTFSTGPGQVTLESTIMPSQQMRFKSNAVTTAPSQAAVMQDLERLFQIRQRGMHSEKLEKGFKKMSVTDVANLKFALKMLGALPVSEDNSLLIDKSQISNSERAGHFDTSTRSVIRRLKKQEGLSSDSIVDRDTFDKIIDLAIQHLGRLDLESVQEQEEDQAQIGEPMSGSNEHDISCKSGRSIIGRFMMHAAGDYTSPSSSSIAPTELSDFSAKPLKAKTRRGKIKLTKAYSMNEMTASSNTMIAEAGEKDSSSNYFNRELQYAEKTTPKFNLTSFVENASEAKARNIQAEEHNQNRQNTEWP